MRMLPNENYDELLRLAALSRSGALYAPPSAGLDEIAEIAKAAFGAMAGMVTFVGADRQVFKAAAGVEPMETPREASFCTHCIAYRNLLWIEDTLEDPRVFDNPFVVGEPHVRFYAGAPIRDVDGWLLGTVCVVDTVPRPYDAALSDILTDLAERATRHILSDASFPLLKRG